METKIKYYTELTRGQVIAMLGEEVAIFAEQQNSDNIKRVVGNEENGYYEFSAFSEKIKNPKIDDEYIMIEIIYRVKNKEHGKFENTGFDCIDWVNFIKSYIIHSY